MKMKKGCFPAALGILLFIDALLSVMLGLGTIYDYIVIIISFSLALPLVIRKVREEIRTRKRMKEIRELREKEKT